MVCNMHLVVLTLLFLNSFLAILGSSFHLSLRHFKINNCDGINAAAVEKTMESVSNDWCNGAMMVAGDISFFINSCPRCADPL